MFVDIPQNQPANRIDILWPENRSRMRTIDSITPTDRPLLWNFSFHLGTESNSERSKSTMPRAQQDWPYHLEWISQGTHGRSTIDRCAYAATGRPTSVAQSYFACSSANFAWLVRRAALRRARCNYFRARMAGAAPVHNRAATLQSSKRSGTSFAKDATGRAGSDLCESPHGADQWKASCCGSWETRASRSQRRRNHHDLWNARDNHG